MGNEMSFITELDSPTQIRLLWTTKSPVKGFAVNSSTFTFRNSQYSLRLYLYLDDHCCLYLMDEGVGRNLPPRSFDVGVCIAIVSDEFLGQITAAADDRPDIWSGDFSDMKARVPGYESTLLLTFRIVLTSDPADLRPKPKTEAKEVQTSSSQTCCHLKGLPTKDTGDRSQEPDNRRHITDGRSHKTDRRRQATKDKEVQTLFSSQTRCHLKGLPTKDMADRSQEPNHRRRITKDKEVQTLSSSSSMADPPKGLSADLQKLMDESLDSDLELRRGHQSIPAHRLILSARSEVFRAMLQSDMKERCSGSVEIEDMEFPVLQHFLRYLYSGTLPELTVELAKRLYEAGDKYAVKDLMERCAEFLGENLTVQNACELLVLADTHNDDEFKKSVIAFIFDREIPKKDPKWSQFCRNHPFLGMEVLNLYVFMH